MKILPLFVLLACVAWQACAQDEEVRPAAAPRGLLKRGPNPRAKATTTTTQAPPQEEEEYADEEYPAEEAEPSSEAPPSSTEGKKLVGAGVRPFRSNADLLASLKKRREQAAEAKTRGHSNSESSAAPEGPVESAKSNYNNKKRTGFTNSAVKETNEEDAASAPAPSKPSRGRFGRPATRSIQPDAEEQDDAAPAPAPARPGRNFSRRN